MGSIPMCFSSAALLTAIGNFSSRAVAGKGAMGTKLGFRFLGFFELFDDRFAAGFAAGFGAAFKEPLPSVPFPSETDPFFAAFAAAGPGFASAVPTLLRPGFSAAFAVVEELRLPFALPPEAADSAPAEPRWLDLTDAFLVLPRFSDFSL